MSQPEPPRPDARWAVLALVLLLLVGLIAVAWGVAHPQALSASPPAAPAAPAVLPNPLGTPPPSPGAPDPTAPSGTPTSTPTARPTTRPTLPWGGRRIFAGDDLLVAYYGTAGTGALGVLGETSPARMQQQLERAAAAFRRPGRPVRLVYELIVTIADRSPGPDRSYSHPLSRAAVEPYVRAARRHGALLLLDIQPGHQRFLPAARHWAWALRQPEVGLALDPEWRLPRGVVPAQQVGSVSAAEINRTSAWLADLVRRHDLPEKLFVLHQFRTAMIRDIDAVRSRPGLAMVQHVDGFGTRSEKRATYRVVARPDLFRMGFKLFYDEDVRRMGPAEVFALRPRVRFVSFQ
ncbi:hypothetical protein GCM10022215_05600 [Nocardioides fonticola]|uniref:Lipoprotein n=1 Tax=Nocardioides fonticola TaxID=450363 RepID=A0ABP7XBJ2_9ACTN